MAFALVLALALEVGVASCVRRGGCGVVMAAAVVLALVLVVPL